MKSHAFSYGPDTQDEMNLRIKAGVDHFHDVRTMSYEDTAMLARSVELDIAVDLGGYTQLARTGIFAMSAAPIQISYIGYLGTMGANYYDYLVADQTIIPEEKSNIIIQKKSPICRVIKSMIQRNLSQQLFLPGKMLASLRQGSYSVVLIIPIKSHPLLLIVGDEYLSKLMVAYY